MGYFLSKQFAYFACNTFFEIHRSFSFLEQKNSSLKRDGAIRGTTLVA